MANLAENTTHSKISGGFLAENKYILADSRITLFWVHFLNSPSEFE